jgi:hypothetical protein
MINNEEENEINASESKNNEENLSFEALTNKSTLEDLKQGFIILKRQLEEEKSNSKQAAEYGLSLLDDFKKLQTKNYELEGEIDSLKADLESTNLVNFFFISKGHLN